MRIAHAAALVVTVLFVSSCHKLRSMAGGGQSASQPSTTPRTGYEDGQEIHVLPGPLSTHHTGSDQGWHVQPFKCSVDEKLLGMCGDAPARPAHGSSYVPSFATPQSSPFHQRYGKWSRSH
jgi:hypothetical protein